MRYYSISLWARIGVLAIIIFLHFDICQLDLYVVSYIGSHR